MVGGERARPRNVRPDLPLVVDVVGRSGVRALPNAPDDGEFLFAISDVMECQLWVMNGLKATSALGPLW